MFNIIKKNIWKYIIEVLISILIISFSFEAFLVYVYIILLIKMDMTTDYLRKLIRVFQVANEAKLAAIARKLKITDEEYADIAKETQGNLTPEQWKSLEEDIKSISV